MRLAGWTARKSPGCHCFVPEPPAELPAPIANYCVQTVAEVGRDQTDGSFQSRLLKARERRIAEPYQDRQIAASWSRRSVDHSEFG